MRLVNTGVVTVNILIVDIEQLQLNLMANPQSTTLLFVLFSDIAFGEIMLAMSNNNL